MDLEFESLHMYDSADISASAHIVKPCKLPPADHHFAVADLDDIALNAVVDLDPCGDLYFDVRGFMDSVTAMNRRPASLSLRGLPQTPSAGNSPVLSPLEQRVPAAHWARETPVDMCQFSPGPTTSREAFPLDVNPEPCIDLVSSTTGLSHAGAPACNWQCKVEETECLSPCSTTAPLPKSTTSARKTPSRKRGLSKDSDEYRSRRARNNVAVRKSRDKAKQRHMSSETRVQQLSDENAALRCRNELLTKELGVMRTLFGNVGIEWSPIVQQLLDESS